MNKEAPNRIYLQWFGVENWGDSTWCQDRTDEDDIGYVREDIADKRLRLLKEMRRKQGSHYRNCLSCGNSKEMGCATDCELEAEVGE